ncbi:MAG TPA: inositol monophosphatase [Firmicutes bacterium]|nr:inositol monophosphatase [Bacillota bacterium]
MNKQVHEIVIQAGQVLLDRQAAGFSVMHKGLTDLVTDVDREVEAFLTEKLRAAFPNHAILGEEEGRTGPQDAEFLWLIDPIDGTTNFAHGLPYFCISVALSKKGQAVLGAVYHPPTETMYWAELGKGAFKNGKRLQVAKTGTVRESLLIMGFPYAIAEGDPGHLDWHARAVRASQSVLTLGSAALDLCQVAEGRAEAFWEKGIYAYDVAAGSLIVTEAGGRLSSISGGEFDLFGREILATNGLIHEELVQLLAAKD